MSSSLELICLGHQKGVGKDTLADLLEERDDFLKVSFAEKLKDICIDLYDLSQEQCFGGKKEVIDPRYGMSPRTIFQRFGTEAVRKQVWDNTWTNYLFSVTIPRAIELGMNKFVISDLRFKNEALAAINWAIDHRAAVRLVKVSRPEILSKDDHSSEQDLADAAWDFVVINDKSPNDMYHKFWSLYRSAIS